MIEDFCATLGLPQSAKVAKKLHKKHFLENFTLKADEKKSLKSDVVSITLSYHLNNENINIEPIVNTEVDYSEIAFIKVVLSDDKHYKKISRIIQNIPYMVVLVLVYHDRFCINISPKRVNQNDSTKLYILEEYYSEWIESQKMSEKERAFVQSLQIENQSFVNFQRFYHDMLSKVVALNLSRYSQNLVTPRETSKETLDTITTLEEEIKTLKTKIKKETHFSEKVNLNIKLKTVLDKLEKIKGEI